MTQLIKHPTSLWVLCSTETWERYGFYAVQSLIALYLSFHLGLDDAYTYMLVGSFTALTYISPIIGGWIADHWLGRKKSVLLGAAVLFLSYIFLAFSFSLHGMILALSSIAVGTGLLKPNISSLLGRQYEKEDVRRNSGFTIFYMGINVGILLGTTVPSQIQAWWGWPACFLSASLGLFVAFFIFLIGMMRLSIPDYAMQKTQQKRGFNYLLAIATLLGLFTISYQVLAKPVLATVFFSTIVFLSVGYVLWIAYKESGLQQKKTLAFLLLCLISTLFWSFYFQMFMVLTLFIVRTVEPTFLGIAFPPPYYVAIQSLGILTFGFILQKFWIKRPVGSIAHKTSVKFSLAILLTFLAYALILLSIGNPHSTQLLFPGLVVVAYLILSFAELMLSPIGLAAVTDLVRPQVVSTMMGIFFVSLGLGGFFSGKLADFASIDKNVHDILLIKANYFSAFSKLTMILAVGLIFSMLITRSIRVFLFKQPVRQAI